VTGRDQPGGALQTEFPFTLPSGYVTDDGTVHKEGTMRLANAADEIKPLRDPRVRANDAYMTIVLLARVITELGTLDDVSTDVVEQLYVSDLTHLQELYERINTRGTDVVDTTCPECSASFEVDLRFERESGASDAPAKDIPETALGAAEFGGSADVPNSEET
jgi:hypothetical protein